MNLGSLPCKEPNCESHLYTGEQSKDQNSVNGGGWKLSDDGSSSESFTGQTYSDSSKIGTRQRKIP